MTTKAPRSTAGARRRSSGPDRITVGLLAVAGFLAVLGLLAWQMSSTPPNVSRPPAIVLRRIVQTTVIETIRGPGRGAGGTSVSQAVSSSGPGAASYPAPTTRTSSA